MRRSQLLLLLATVVAAAVAVARATEPYDYEPVADPAAVVTAGAARFTILTCAAAGAPSRCPRCSSRAAVGPPPIPSPRGGRNDRRRARLVRMEYARVAGAFEDRATIAVLNRRLPEPRHAEGGGAATRPRAGSGRVRPADDARRNSFTSSIADGILHIATDALRLRYVVGAPFAPDTLSALVVAGNVTWRFRDRGDGNLLGTIRSLDMMFTTCAAPAVRGSGTRSSSPPRAAL